MFVRSHPGLSRRLSANLATPLAMVLAETCARASDAAELIVVEYNERPSITDTVQSTKG
jgi:carbon-monoxide dehydrogenase large subunit